jgi:hypothetical protein
MTPPAEDLAARQAGVRARLVQAIREVLWQAHGQPLDTATLDRDARLAADEALAIIIAEADLFHSGGERLAAALQANEDCRDEILRMRGRRR